MSEQPVTDEIFPRNSGKSYALVELMPQEGPLVGKGPDDTVFAFPVVLLWEVALTLGVTFLLFLFSLIKQAPLETIANPLVTTDPAKAPWYFMGLQELLEHMHPMVAGVLIPTLAVLFLIAVPYIDQSRDTVGVWFGSARGRRIVAWTAVYVLVVVPIYVVLDSRFPVREMLRGVAPTWVAQGLVPILILGVIVVLPALVVRARHGTTRDVLLCLFTVLLTAAFVLTLTGFFFRGPGFKLYLPWKMPEGYSPLDNL